LMRKNKGFAKVFTTANARLTSFFTSANCADASLS
jgi:hypothetical protein